MTERCSRSNTTVWPNADGRRFLTLPSWWPIRLGFRWGLGCALVFVLVARSEAVGSEAGSRRTTTTNVTTRSTTTAPLRIVSPEVQAIRRLMRDPVATTQPNEYMRIILARRKEVIRRVEDILRRRPKHPDRDVLLGAKLDSLRVVLTLQAKPLDALRAEAEEILSSKPGPSLAARAAYVRMMIDIAEHRKRAHDDALSARRERATTVKAENVAESGASSPATSPSTTTQADPLALLNRLLAEKAEELRARSAEAVDWRRVPVDAAHEGYVLEQYRRYVREYPTSRHTPRLLGELIRAAWRGEEGQSAEKYIRQLRRDHSGHVETRSMEAELTKRELVGKPLRLQLRDLSGREIDLADMKGSVVVVCFWATWSEASRKALPAIDATIRSFGDADVRAVGVALNRSRGPVEAFCRKHDIDWPQHIDGGQWDGPLARRFGIRKLPQVLVVDQAGVLRAWGPEDLSALRGLLEESAKDLR